MGDTESSPSTGYREGDNDPLTEEPLSRFRDLDRLLLARLGDSNPEVPAAGIGEGDKAAIIGVGEGDSMSPNRGGTCASGTAALSVCVSSGYVDKGVRWLDTVGD